MKGGHGGNGLPKYGGVGGQGGCVYFVASEKVTLRNVMKRYAWLEQKRKKENPVVSSMKINYFFVGPGLIPSRLAMAKIVPKIDCSDAEAKMPNWQCQLALQ